MTEKPNEQSFNPYPILAVVLALALVGFFIYATAVDQTLFIPLSIGLLAILLYLFPQRNYLNKKLAEIALQNQNLEEGRNLLSADIENEKIAIESFQEKIVNYSQLKGVIERLSMCLYLDDTSKMLSEEVNTLLGGRERTVILYLFHSKTGELGISSSHKGEMQVNIKSKKGDVFDHWIIRGMQPLLVEDTRNDYRFDIDKIQADESRPVRSLISVPLKVGNKALGILRVDSPKEGEFTTESLRFLMTIGDLGAVAIENAQLYERVEQLAIKDSLTGLYLRRYLLDRLPEEIGRQLRTKGQLSFLMLDLDKFKQYNDKFGHTAGDIVLRTIGGLLAEFFNQPGNLVCRYGGEEFCVLLPDCPRQKAKELAEEVRAKINQTAITLRREETTVTVSVGVATFPKDAADAKEIIHRADQALYKAKEGGRNRICFASQE